MFFVFTSFDFIYFITISIKQDYLLWGVYTHSLTAMLLQSREIKKSKPTLLLLPLRLVSCGPKYNTDKHELIDAHKECAAVAVSVAVRRLYLCLSSTVSFGYWLAKKALISGSGKRKLRQTCWTTVQHGWTVSALAERQAAGLSAAAAGMTAKCNVVTHGNWLMKATVLRLATDHFVKVVTKFWHVALTLSLSLSLLVCRYNKIAREWTQKYAM